jgi:hypothetical protein
MGSTATTYAALLKTRYTGEKIRQLTEPTNVALGLLRKNTGFSGTGMAIPIIHTRPQGIASAALSTAQGNKSNIGAGKFTLTVGNYYGAVDIGHRVMMESRDNPGAFLQNKTVEIDGLYSRMADDLDIYIHGNGGFALGQVSSIDTPTNVITLSDAADSVNFEVNMELTASTADGTSGTIKTGSATVSAVDREAGTITIDDYAQIDTPTGPVANDYLFREGTFGNTSNLEILKGFGAFIASSGSSLSALYGLTRSTYPTELGGCRVPSADYTGKSIEERLQLLGVYMTGRYHSRGGDVCLMHPEDWQSLAIALQSKGTRPAADTNTQFGYVALEAVLGGQMVKVYADRHQPKGTAFLLRMDTWTLWSMGQLLQPVDQDGVTILRQATSMDFEYRLVSYPGLVTNAPVDNGRIPL